MRVEQIIARDNELMEAGHLDDQIICDFTKYMKDRINYQIEHLNKKVKGKSHHYDEWLKKCQQQIVYAERILECVWAKALKDIDAAMLTPDQMDEMMKKDGRVKGIVAMGVYELVTADGFDGFKTKLSERLTGSLLLQDVQYQLLGLDDGFLYFEVSGDASCMLSGPKQSETFAKLPWLTEADTIKPEPEKSYLCTLRRISDGYEFWDKVTYLDFGWKIPGTVEVVAWCDPELYRSED